MKINYYHVLLLLQVLTLPARGLCQWSQENLPEFKFYVQAAGTDRKVAFVGGLRGGLNSSSGVDILDIEGPTWLHQELFTAVTLPGTTVADDKLFIGGGTKVTNGTGVSQSLVQIFNLKNSTSDFMI